MVIIIFEPRGWSRHSATQLLEKRETVFQNLLESEKCFDLPVLFDSDWSHFLVCIVTNLMVRRVVSAVVSQIALTERGLCNAAHCIILHIRYAILFCVADNSRARYDWWRIGAPINFRRRLYNWFACVVIAVVTSLVEKSKPTASKMLCFY